MTELKHLLDALIITDFTKEEQYYYDNCDDENKEIFMTNRRYFLDKKLRQDALKKVLVRRYENYMSHLLDAENAEELLPTIKKIKELDEKKDECLKSPYVFITISPEKSVGVLELIRLIEKFVKLKWVKSYCYVLEQRYSGEPDDIHKKIGDGLHSHIFLDKGEHRPSHLSRDLKRILININSNNDISYRWPRDVEKTFNYILGEKKDPSKQVKQEQDRLWRQQNSLKDFYGTRWEASAPDKNSL